MLASAVELEWNEMSQGYLSVSQDMKRIFSAMC